MVKWDGSERLQLTFGKEGAGNPRFSPDGKYISFLSSRPGPAKGTQVWVLDRRGGEPEQLTAITDQEIEDYIWSPDSKKLLLTLQPKSEPDAGRRQAARAAQAHRHRPLSLQAGHPGLPPQRRVGPLYLYDIATKKAEKLTTDKNVNEENAAWSPDGAVDRLRQQPRSRSRPHQQHRRVRRRPQARLSAHKLTTWTGPDGGSSPGLPTPNPSPTPKVPSLKLRGILAGQARRGHSRRQGHLSRRLDSIAPSAALASRPTASSSTSSPTTASNIPPRLSSSGGTVKKLLDRRRCNPLLGLSRRPHRRSLTLKTPTSPRSTRLKTAPFASSPRTTMR